MNGFFLVALEVQATYTFKLRKAVKCTQVQVIDGYKLVIYLINAIPWFGLNRDGQEII